MAQTLYNTVHYNTVLDITRLSVGPQLQLVIWDSFAYITYTFYSRYNTVWITGFDSNNSVIKRFCCMLVQMSLPMVNQFYFQVYSFPYFVIAILY